MTDEADQGELDRRAMMRASLPVYAMGMWPRFTVSPFHRLLASVLQDTFEGKHDRVMLFAPPRHGKAINYMTPVWTPTGWKKHGELRVGDEVFSPDGYPVPVQAVGQTLVMNRLVHLSTGESIACHADHDWLVKDKRYTRWSPENRSVMSTDAMLNAGVKIGKPGVRGNYHSRFSLEPVQPLAGGNDPKVNPYYLGYYLGDGQVVSGRLVVGTKDEAEFVSKCLPTFGHNDDGAYTHPDTGVKYYRFPGNALREMLREVGTFGVKHLDDSVLTSSVEYRKSVLAGLIDSDGSVDKTGRVRISNTNKPMVDAISTLVRSLGMQASVIGFEPTSSGFGGNKTCYHVAFVPTVDLPTQYSRKAIVGKRAKRVTVENIECGAYGLGNCIQVHGGSYVVGTTMVPTENSLLTSRFAPAYFLGRWPHKKIIAASHTADLASDFGGEVRDTLRDPLHCAVWGPAAGLDPSTTAKDDFKILGGGSYRAVGVGQTPIGKGADVFLIDDPIKGREDAQSEAARKKLRDWYTAAVYSRLEGQGAIVLMHQRWHEDDLAGWLLREHAQENWKVVSLPALCTDPANDPLGRLEGEALWPEKYDEERLYRIAAAIGPRDWLSMWQQQPRSAEGDEFKKEFLLYYEKAPIEIAPSMRRYLIVDPASGKKKSDYTTFVVIGIGQDGNYYLLDIVRDRFKLKARGEKLFELHRKWRPQVTAYEEYGMQADLEHMAMTMETENYRFQIVPLGGTMKKEDRIRRLVPDLEAGKWYAPRTMWYRNTDGKLIDLVDYVIEQEMLAFPVSKFDDVIDAWSRFYDSKLTKPKPSSDAMGSGGTNSTSTGGPKAW